MEKNYENIIYGRSLKEIRIKHHLTQEKAGQLTGLESKYISQIECGITKGTISTMLKFCKAYNVTPNDILRPFLNTGKVNKKIDQTADDLARLPKKDREIVISLIEILLKKHHEQRKESL